MKNLLFLAQDFAPSKGLAVVAEQCYGLAVNVGCIFGYGKQGVLTEDAVLSMDTDSIVILGMGYSPEASKIELLAAERAKELGIPVMLYADTWNCAAREWFAPVRTAANVVCVVSEAERLLIQPLYPRAEVMVGGNPLWDNAAFPERTPSDVRRELGVSLNKKTVLISCRKEKSINIQHIVATLAAVREVSDLSIRVFASVHPGAPEQEFYKGLFSDFRISLLQGSSMEILPGIDVVVNAGSGIGIEAVYQRVPVIEFFCPAVANENQKLYGKITSPLVDSGVAVEAVSYMEIASLLLHLFKGNTLKARLRRAASVEYPLPESRLESVMRLTGIIKSLI